MTYEAPAPEQFACTLVDLAKDLHSPNPYASARDAVAGSRRLDVEEGILTPDREAYYEKVTDEIDRLAVVDTYRAVVEADRLVNPAANPFNRALTGAYARNYR